MTENGVCFVIMGYGIKTDHATGRELDLDKTYENIIKPAAQEAGLECIRADEIRHSGTIDLFMYKYLIEADIVIADLSTSNPNAFYELGVRHALRPRTTIAIAEKQLKPPFDINHTVIHKYEHLEKDIGFTEVNRFKNDLIETIKEVQNNDNIDSPVYTYLKSLKPPLLEATEDLPRKKSEESDSLSTITKNAKKALNYNDFSTAIELLNHAKIIDSNNDYIIQNLALATYKNKQPSRKDALISALEIINKLDLANTTDPETLGIAGAIYKRLWSEDENMDYLSSSIDYYKKGFYIKNDYYNGINLAFVLNVRSLNQGHEEEALADYILANRIRKKTIEICLNLKESPNFNYRSDKYWIIATLEEAYFGLEDDKNYKKYKDEAILLAKADWERDTTEKQIEELKLIKNVSRVKQMF